VPAHKVRPANLRGAADGVGSPESAKFASLFQFKIAPRSGHLAFEPQQTLVTDSSRNKDRGRIAMWATGSATSDSDSFSSADRTKHSIVADPGTLTGCSIRTAQRATKSRCRPGSSCKTLPQVLTRGSGCASHCWRCDVGEAAVPYPAGSPFHTVTNWQGKRRPGKKYCQCGHRQGNRGSR